MKRLLIALLFLPTLAFGGYYDLQQQSVVKDTASITNDWYYRGSFHIGGDTYTVKASEMPTYITLGSTGTIIGVDATFTGDTVVEGINVKDRFGTITTDTTSLRTDITAIGVTTGSIRTDLNTEISDRGVADTAIGVDTGTLRTDLTTETSSRISGDLAIGIDTGTLRTDVSALQAVDVTIGVDTASLRTDLTSVGVATSTLLSQTASFGGDVSGTYDALQVDYVKGVLMSTPSWVTNEFLVMKGTYVVTNAAGAGDMILANLDTYTAIVTTGTTQTISGTKTFDDIATSDDSLMKLVYSTNVADITSLTISGLDGNTDKEYLVVMKSSSAAESTINFHFNADSTSANYEFGSMYNSGATTLAYYGGNSLLVGRSGTLTSIMTATLSVGTNGRIGLFHNSYNSTANKCDAMQFNSLSWEDKTTNITSMTFTFSESTVIHQFSLYSRR